MRTQLELWQIVKDNFDAYFCNGLCLLISRLYIKGIISNLEHELLEQELSEYGDNESYFLGKKGNPKPRLEFIEKMIKKHSKKD